LFEIQGRYSSRVSLRPEAAQNQVFAMSSTRPTAAVGVRERSTPKAGFSAAHNLKLIEVREMRLAILALFRRVVAARPPNQELPDLLFPG
jgi:hypothetical protein